MAEFKILVKFFIVASIYESWPTLFSFFSFPIFMDYFIIDKQSILLRKQILVKPVIQSLRSNGAKEIANPIST